MVVDDQCLTATGKPWRHQRRRGELIDDDVAALCLFGVGERGQRRVAGLVLDDVHEDVRLDAAAARGVAEAQRVPADRVATVEHGDEVVNSAHVVGHGRREAEPVCRPPGAGGQRRRRRRSRCG